MEGVVNSVETSVVLDLIVKINSLTVSSSEQNKSLTHNGRETQIVFLNRSSCLGNLLY